MNQTSRTKSDAGPDTDKPLRGFCPGCPGSPATQNPDKPDICPVCPACSLLSCGA